MFHQNVDGEGTLVVNNYKGEKISDVGGAKKELASIQLNIDDPNVEIKSINDLPSKNADLIDINVRTGKGLRYFETGNPKLGDYRINLDSGSKFAVNADDVHNFAYTLQRALLNDQHCGR